jgi:cytochrome c-type biogenesis protein CcmH/NrfF
MSNQSNQTLKSAKAPLWIAAIVAIVVLALGFGIREARQVQYNGLPLAQKVEVICSDLRAPGDPSTVSESSLGLAYEIRQQVTSDVQNGMTKSQVLDAMVQAYGDSVLAVPRFHGFGMMTWFAPLIVALIVMWGILTFIRRSAATKAALQTNPPVSDSDRVQSPNLKSRLKDYL